MYRILETLLHDKFGRIEAGAVDDLQGWSDETIAALLRKRRIAEVQGPPLSVLATVPEWKDRIEASSAEGTIVDYIEDEETSAEDREAAIKVITPDEDIDEYEYMG